MRKLLHDPYLSEPNTYRAYRTKSVVVVASELLTTVTVSFKLLPSLSLPIIEIIFEVLRYSFFVPSYAPLISIFEALLL